MLNPVRKSTYQIIYRQAMWAAVLCLLGYVFLGQLAAKSVVLAALVGILPGFYFAWRISRKQYASQAREILKQFYRGEGVKLILTAVLFVGVFKFSQVNPVVFFGTFLILQWAYWFNLVKA